MKNPEIKEASGDEVKKNLSNLKEKIITNEVIPQEEVNEEVEFFNKLLKITIPLAKKEWLTSKEEEIVRKVVNRLVWDIKKHPNAYIMSVKNIKKLWISYSTLKENDKFGFIGIETDLNNSLWAEFKMTPEENAIFEKYDIWQD